MGSIIGKPMDENMKKQQEFMLQTQRLLLERQIQMQNQMREKMMAMQMGRARDMFMWFSSFYAVTAVLCIIGARHRRGAVIPLLPLTFILGYQYDLAYGNKMMRIRAEADRILDDEALMLEMPHGLPTYSTIEAGRLDQKDKERLTKSNDLFL
ncbi:plasminogen receptor (KT)-like [Gigantopelta aegis]|uniref:plasminogen receptor (KT)-like n=1 Tax=Gigantopelta aegis TaxID=1735272 RepID=UPI001B88B307|nr:plasminogen receptor (KT)-like [Gigantopelta aegis]